MSIHIKDYANYIVENEPDEYYGYIYITTNTKNGMKYVGQKTGRIDPSYIGSGHYQWIDIEENGYKKSDMIVEILEYAYSREEITKKENYWIKTLNAIKDPVYYNAVYGGNHPNVVKHSEETIALLKEIHSNTTVLNKDGKERRVKINSDEMHKLIDEEWDHGLARELPNPTKGKFGPDNPHYGMKRSPETRKNISNAMKGRVPWNKGKSTKQKVSRHMHHPITGEKIMARKDEVDKRLSEGFIFGRG